MADRNRFIGGAYHFYKAYILGLCKGISPQSMAGNIIYRQYYIPPIYDPEIPIGLWSEVNRMY
jgi:hypothetical protein